MNAAAGLAPASSDGGDSALRAKLRLLPLWAQVFVAVRMARRALLALPAAQPVVLPAALPAALPAMPRKPANSMAEQRLAKGLSAALDAAERCVFNHYTTAADLLALHEGAELRGRGRGDMPQASEAVFWCVDACRAAIAANDFPVDDAVTHAAMNVLRVLGRANFSAAVQVWAVARAEIDTLDFACREAQQGTYFALPETVRGRLIALQPLNVWQLVSEAHQIR